MKLLVRPALVLCLILTGCGLSPQEKADLAVVQTSGVSSATYDKMVHGDSLSISDICALEHAGVNEGVIVRYIREHDTIYVLSDRDASRLAAAGASQSLIDYMRHTVIAHTATYPTTTVVTYAPYGPVMYSQLSASSYWGTQYYDPFWGPPYY